MSHDPKKHDDSREPTVMGVADKQKVRFAREQRKQPSLAERVLWRKLRGRRQGVKFRRQHPIGKFVLDFYSPEARLAIELDGESHQQQAEYDTRRDAQLANQGIRTLRFANTEVLAELLAVLKAIHRALQERRRS